MFEKLNQRIASRRQFYLRLVNSAALGIFFIIVAELIGMVGYHYYEEMTWIDSFVNSAMILSGMGPLTPLHSTGGKLFAGFYALFSGLLFIAVMGIIFAPVIHRFFHALHVQDKATDKEVAK